MIKPSVEQSCNTHPCEVVKCTHPDNCGYYNKDIPCSYYKYTSCEWGDGEGATGWVVRKTTMWNNSVICMSRYESNCSNIVRDGYRYRSGELIDKYEQTEINPGYCYGFTYIYCVKQTPV